jgi:hypothetical protein
MVNNWLRHSGHAPKFFFVTGWVREPELYAAREDDHEPRISSDCNDRDEKKCSQIEALWRAKFY